MISFERPRADRRAAGVRARGGRRPDAREGALLRRARARDPLGVREPDVGAALKTGESFRSGAPAAGERAQPGLADARPRDRDAVLGRRRDLPVRPRGRAGRRRRRGHRHARAEGALPGPLPGRQAEVGQHGDDRGPLRVGHRRHPHHRRARRRPLGAERREDLRDQRPQVDGRLGRLHGGLGHRRSRRPGAPG